MKMCANIEHCAVITVPVAVGCGGGHDGFRTLVICKINENCTILQNSDKKFRFLKCQERRQTCCKIQIVSFSAQLHPADSYIAPEERLVVFCNLGSDAWTSESSCLSCEQITDRKVDPEITKSASERRSVTLAKGASIRNAIHGEI